MLIGLDKFRFCYPAKLGQMSLKGLAQHGLSIGE